MSNKLFRLPKSFDPANAGNHFYSIGYTAALNGRPHAIEFHWKPSAITDYEAGYIAGNLFRKTVKV